MKNYLVVLVTIGLGYAYWYPVLEKAPVAPPPPPPAHVRAPFVASHSLLDEPATRVGGHHGTQAAWSLGNDNTDNSHQ